MSTSIFEGRVRFDASRSEGTFPLSTTLVRDRVLNNALHFADENARALVNWMAPDATLIGANTYRTPEAVATSYRLVECYGPLPITLHADGSPYRIRAHVFGASSGGHGVTFAIVLSPVVLTDGGEATDLASISDRAVEYAATSSASPSWLAAGVGAVTFDPPASVVGSDFRDTLTDTSGDPTAVEIPVVYAAVFAKTANVASTPLLYGVHISEYVGGV